MRAIAALMLSALVSPAWAVDYRWTSAFAQGTVENIIRNEHGSSVNIYCPLGQTDTTPGFFVEVDKVRPRAGETVDVQIIIDRKNHPFSLDENQFKAAGRANMNALHALIDALVQSKGRSFVVEFPKFGTSERFSLLDARRAFKSASYFLKECN